jgi:hypothetical protein
VPMSAKADGMSYEDLCMHLLASASLEHSSLEHSNVQKGGA